MLNEIRRKKRGQSLVIVALSATALFGIIALGLDAGRLYFQRRDVQNAADAGALAGAQALLPNGGSTSPGTANQTAANCEASNFALLNLQAAPRDGGCTPTPSGAYQGSAITEPAANNFPATVQVWTPSRNNPDEIHVRVTYNVPLTFAAVLGFTSSAVVADAYAHGGFQNKTYTIFGFDAGGNGNSVNYDQNGNIQIDDGNNGQDICQPDPNQGRLVSNAKWHAPNPGGGWNNLNGQFYYSQASDTHALVTYWYGGVSTSQPVEDAPNYQPPLKPTTWGTQSTAAGVTTFTPGLWTSNITISGGTNIFENGIYYFEDANFTISGNAIVANTSDGSYHYGPYGGITNLPAAADGTNGVEFVFDGKSSFSATSSGGHSPSVFFVGPSFNPSGTDSIVFFITTTNSASGPNGTPWSETIDGTKPTPGGYPFQIWGTIYNADTNGSHGTVVTLTAATKLPAGSNPAPVEPNAYAVNGEVVSPQVDLDGGGLATGNYTPSKDPSTNIAACKANPSSFYEVNPAGLVDQFNPHYVPHFHGLAYLVK